jgi:hypothetical protein
MPLFERLGYAGLLPFIAATLVVSFGVHGAESFFVVYSAFILSFMSGACWGVQQAHPDRANNIDLSIAIGVFLWGWLMYFMPFTYALLGLLVGFISLLLLEQRPLYVKTYSRSYRRLRWVLTMVVSTCHIVLLVW